MSEPEHRTSAEGWQQVARLCQSTLAKRDEEIAFLAKDRLRLEGELLAIKAACNFNPFTDRDCETAVRRMHGELEDAKARLAKLGVTI